ncbi:ABC transporter ATP-binding protein [Candidatus Babeliales bacterium]|nr:ABC transporter ATP-binding protein [Candidatus Babeliales bacterium]
MKRLVLISCVMMSLQANDTDWRKVVHEHQALEQKTVADWYMIGLGLYHLNRLPRALVAFERAARGADGQILRDSLYNIDIIKSELGQHIDRSWQGWYKRMMNECLVVIPRWVWQISALICALCLMLLLVFGWGGVVLRSGMIMVSLLSFFLAYFVYTREQSARAFVINDTTLYAGPASTYPQRCNVSAACELVLYQHEQGWYKVRAGDRSVRGWIEGRAIEVL